MRLKRFERSLSNPPLPSGTLRKVHLHAAFIRRAGFNGRITGSRAAFNARYIGSATRDTRRGMLGEGEHHAVKKKGLPNYNVQAAP